MEDVPGERQFTPPDAVLEISTGFQRGRDFVDMEWTRSETLALAAPQCAYCYGLGLRDGQDNRKEPCNCVLRQIFRDCYTRFRTCSGQDKYVSRSRLELVPGSSSNYNWARKDEEFAADFCLVSRRALNDVEYRLFKYHFLLGADWRLCCRKLNVDKGIFFHNVYRIQEKLGRIFRELKPYALYPIDEYFDGTRLGVSATRRVFKIRPVKPPLKIRKPAA